MTGLRVVVVSYRRADLLKQCLLSIAEHLPKAAVTVWDNRSDQSNDVQALAADFPSIEWHFHDRNAGFAAAVNAVAQHHPGVDLLLLNPDSILTSALPLTRAALADERVAAAAPRVTSRRGQDFDVAHRRLTLTRAVVQYAGWASLLRGRALSDLYRHAPTEVDGYLTGACLLIKRQAFDELNGFDEQFFLYGEEADWQHRAVQAGWMLRLADEVGIEHEGHGTVNDDANTSRRSFDLLIATTALRLQQASGRWAANAYLVATAALNRIQRSKKQKTRSGQHVLITSNDMRFGGAERQRVTLANILSSRGYIVTFVCLQGLGPLVAELDSRVRVIRRPAWFPYGLPSASEAGATGALITGTTRTEVVFGLLWRRLRAGRGRRRWLVAAHNPPRTDGPTYDRDVAAGIRRSDLVIALSAQHWDELTRFQRLNSHHLVVANGVARTGEPQPHAPNHPLRIRFVGRMVEEKNVGLLLDALAQLTDREWVLTIYGDGPDRARLQAQTPPAVADRVDWAGWADGPDIALAGADLLCVPSRAEAFPMVILEAMSRGVAVAASDVCAVGEMLDNGAAGVLVCPVTVTSWRTALARLLDDPKQLTRYAAVGHQRYLDLYTDETMADGYTTALAEVLTS